MAQLIREWVVSCKQNIREPRIERRLSHPPEENPNEYITAPEDAMQIHSMPELPPSGGYENIDSQERVFLFCVTYIKLSRQHNCQGHNQTETKHYYLPMAMSSDKASAFMSHVIKDVSGVLSVYFKARHRKARATIGMLERSHASTKRALKIETGERRSLWHNYVSIAVLSYNTSYYARSRYE